MKNLIIVALIATGALAMGQGSMMPTYADFDVDGNGKVTQKEFQQVQLQRMSAKAESGKMMRNAGNAPVFSDIDTNNDGSIDKQEFQAHQAKNSRNMRRGQGKNR